MIAIPEDIADLRASGYANGKIPIWNTSTQTFEPGDSSGGGGGGGTPWGDVVVPASGPGGAEDDEFNDGALDLAWSTVAPAGSTTATESNDLLSLKLTGTGSSAIGGVVKSMAGGASAPTTIETGLRFLNNSTVVVAGLVFSAGATPASSAVYAGIIASGSTLRLAFRSGTFASLGSEVSKHAFDVRSGYWLPRMHLRLVWAAGNTWEVEASPDGVSWLTYSSHSFTLTPTHYGIAGSPWSSDSMILSGEYFRVT